MLDFYVDGRAFRCRASRVPAYQCTRGNGEHRHSARIRHRLRGCMDHPPAQARLGAAVPNTAGAVGANPRNHNFVGDDVEPDRDHLDPVGSLARRWYGDLFQLRRSSQPRAAAERPKSEGRSRDAELTTHRSLVKSCGVVMQIAMRHFQRLRLVHLSHRDHFC